MKHRRNRLATGLLVLVGFLGVACEWRGVQESQKPNEAPAVRITGGAEQGEDADYRVEFQWFGSDPDGIIDHFLVAVDDTTRWERTTRFSGSFAVAADSVYHDGSPPTGSQFHTFYVKAIDDRNAASSVDSRTFNASTILPTVKILRPLGVGSEKIAPVSTYVGVVWSGRDEDATNADKKPVGYQMKLVHIENSLEGDDLVTRKLVHTLPPTGWSPIRETNLLVPESLRVAEPTGPDEPFPELPTPEHYYRSDWWPKPEHPYEAESFQLADLPPGDYAFAVRAIDQAGAFYPNEILLHTMTLATDGTRGEALKLDALASRPVNPRITITEQNLLGTKIFTNRGEVWRVEVPSNVDLEFRWTMDATWYGAENGNTNFGLDVPDPECDVCQSPDGIGGWNGWGVTSTFKHRFTDADAGQQHTFYVRARDRGDRVEREGLAAVVVNVIAFSFDRTALWIDDFKMSGVNDCEHDAIVEPMLEYAIAPHLEPGEDLDVLARQRLGGCGESSVPLKLSLSVMTRYKLIFWNVSADGSGTTLGHLTANPNQSDGTGTENYLATFVRAGGRLIVWGRFPVGALLGDFYPSAQSYQPEFPVFDNPNFGPGTFVWDVLKLRTEFDRVGRSGLAPLLPLCSGVIALEATPFAASVGYPVGEPDPTGYDRSRTAIWTGTWRLGGGPRADVGSAGPEIMTGRPPLRVFGLDTLYTYVPNAWSYAHVANPAYDPDNPDCAQHPGLPECQPFVDETAAACEQSQGSALADEPAIVRFDDPFSIQGRVVWIGTPLYLFADGPDDVHTIRELMRRLTDWVFETGP